MQLKIDLKIDLKKNQKKLIEKNQINNIITNMELKNIIRTTNKYISILEKNWIKTVRDLLQYFPRTYENRENIRTLDQLEPNEKWIATTKGKIISKKIFNRWSKKIYDIHFIDEKWNKWYISIFNSWFMASKIIENKRYIIIW